MAKKFSISEGMLNGISKNTRKVEEFQAKENFKIEYINIDRIRRNEKNFYEIVDIEALAEDIKLNGLNHNLVVRKLDNDMYELISGERRYTALSKLVNEGNKEFNLVPCKVIESNDIDSEIILIQANAQSRELTEVEKLTQVERLQELYKIKKKNGEKVPGKIRDIIANDLKLSPTQVGRYERINNKLIPELKAIIEQGNLTIANASEFSSLSEENQRVILNIIDDETNMSKQEAIDLKNKLKKIEEEKELELKKAYEEKELELKRLEEEKKNQVSKLKSENENLKKKLDSNNIEEERKEIEGQIKIEFEEKLRNEKVILEEELKSKYDKKIEDITNEVKENNLEKQRLKDELSKLKEKSNNEVDIKNTKENFVLVQNLKLIDNSFKDLKSQINKMKKENVKVAEETKAKEFLEKYQKEISDLLKKL
ncbi:MULTISPECIES: ParB/RepB/Spo0J family partition protein [Clostridium]|uniref:ParB/RepB/Spo0J family partition protein n=1 Tax=Clostridium TaxID=1485 RepID=UPI000D9D83CA|nr:ParB N-terminal domain-containing protein [Clostridium perfringens]MBP2860040.1 ParB N-terminal domain-containing protein [Clostridium perfringens]MDG6876855.1 putative chromosome-partitioning protein ParB [Clostridium perfringens]MDG6886559.1 putative chromosome-partitioning protein ParB [Clostridium perfringens]MDH5060637.1 putative chromosome-partitioning protein ParB [Clostridium perfringens NCTC 8239]MDH5077970.1 putative chromosome-partitioning protein ParB [Clostridium perfringens]